MAPGPRLGWRREASAVRDAAHVREFRDRGRRQPVLPRPTHGYERQADRRDLRASATRFGGVPARSARCVRRPRQTEPQPRGGAALMTTWEYTIIFAADPTLTFNDLREAGELGWELVAVVADADGATCFLKRPKR